MFRKAAFSQIVVVRTLKWKSAPERLNKIKPKIYFDYYSYPIVTHSVKSLIDDNSRHITVEGSPGTGKEKFARKIADYFDLAYVDDVKDDDLHILRFDAINVDLRKYNSMIPPHAQQYTRESFFNDPDPINNGRPLFLQKYFYYWRYFYNAKALCHMFNTGQGFVQKRSAWSDNAMAKTIHKLGLMSDLAYKYYNVIRCESITRLYRPHIIIYLKSSPEKIRERLKKQNRWEATALNFSDEFLNTYAEMMQSECLAKLSNSSRILEVDVDEIDLDDDENVLNIAESISHLNQNYKLLDKFNPLFSDWREDTYRNLALHLTRNKWMSARKAFYRGFRQVRIPFSLREGIYNYEERSHYTYIFNYDKRLTEDMNFDPKLFGWTKVLLPTRGTNYNDPWNTPAKNLLEEYLEEFEYPVRHYHGQ